MRHQVDEGIVESRLLRSVCGMSAVECAHLMDEERVYAQEGILQVNVDALTQPPR